MSNLHNIYFSKLTTPEKAVQIVKSGDWIDYGWCTCTPTVLDKALAKRSEELFDVKFRGGILLSRPAIFDVPNVKEHFTWNSWHMGGIERAAINEGFCFYSPLRYSELPLYYKHLKTNVAMIKVCPMDNEGYFNFGPNESHLESLCENADVIIVEVNKNMPYCKSLRSKNGVHVSDVTMIVEGDDSYPIPLKSPTPTEIDEKVAENIIKLIPNGACLQLGIGGMPNAVGHLIAKSDLKDLGIHTEMYVDSFLEIEKAGKLNGSKKTIDKGLSVYAFAAGSSELYEHLNNNDKILSSDVDYTNRIHTIASIDNFISINNIVDIDLFGQANSESAGIKHLTGAGGQLDFVLGAYLSKGGKSILCCSSTLTKKDGTRVSRILPTLNNGSICTDTRACIDYFATEYGIVNLKGLSTWERAESLISLAHPDFREELIKDAQKLNIWRNSNKLL